MRNGAERVRDGRRWLAQVLGFWRAAFAEELAAAPQRQ
jgi:hypothetical protein